MKVGRAIYWLLGAVETVLDLFSTGRRVVKAARQGKLPLNDTDPMPLSRPRAKK